MKILNFHLRGKFAHFRRYYSNSSALTYSVPPRTTVIGIIAGMLGYKRDTYYDDFSLEKCQLAVGIKAYQKKSVHTLNLLMIKSVNDLNASQPFHSQTPTELISPQQIWDGFLDYEIWFHHIDENIMRQLEKQLKQAHGYYLTQGIAVALGTAQHIGWIEYGSECTGEVVADVEAEIHSIIPVSSLQSIDITKNKSEICIFKEDLPLQMNMDRSIRQKGEFIINTTPFPVRARVRKAVQLSDHRHITWMEV